MLSIALSVGAAAVVFAAVKSVLIDPLPYARTERLVLLRSEFPKMQDQSQGDWVVWNDAQEVIRRTRTLESVGVYRYAVYDLAGEAGATPEALYGLKATANFGEKGTRSFLMDASGLIHAAAEDRAATASDPILADSNVH